MITREEILKGNECPPELEENLKLLLERMNNVRAHYGKPMQITSGLRTKEDHLRIYKQKGITDKSKIPMKSKHLFCLACDVYDPSGELNEWCTSNEDLLRDIGIWLETRQGNWQHFQVWPFGSYKAEGTIWFNP